jgi:hypothetical protein
MKIKIKDLEIEVISNNVGNQSYDNIIYRSLIDTTSIIICFGTPSYRLRVLSDVKYTDSLTNREKTFRAENWFYIDPPQANKIVKHFGLFEEKKK